MTTHAEKRVIPHSPENLYALVLDVNAYPQFLPWCHAARIISRTDDKLTADLIIGFKFYREKFTSYVDFDSKSLAINVEYAEGPFKYLRNSWSFHPHEEGTEIEFHVDFEFKSMVFQSVIEVFFSEAVKRMVRAFETRADLLYPYQGDQK